MGVFNNLRWSVRLPLFLVFVGVVSLARAAFPAGTEMRTISVMDAEVRQERVSETHVMEFKHQLWDMRQDPELRPGLAIRHSVAETTPFVRGFSRDPTENSLDQTDNRTSETDQGKVMTSTLATGHAAGAEPMVSRVGTCREANAKALGRGVHCGSAQLFNEVTHSDHWRHRLDRIRNLLVPERKINRIGREIHNGGSTRSGYSTKWGHV
ncbi:hypothetical protein R3X27_17155 [Tropicimonas sp. TH_r6]|uniref:hypothetical protein n=1 Tax=Tropicimonas sp. TH_r6 TaxID=3082085 RepID=UPI0029555B9C|nr:hypothetical protein [Tropicimonas sp. TH_r6]MDV7144410.1 hypothetical protein [Tropicimonas sp. TH_r6]